MSRIIVTAHRDDAQRPTMKTSTARDNQSLQNVKHLTKLGVIINEPPTSQDIKWNICPDMEYDKFPTVI